MEVLADCLSTLDSEWGQGLMPGVNCRTGPIDAGPEDITNGRGEIMSLYIRTSCQTLSKTLVTSNKTDPVDFPIGSV